jgi:hypothetical protein
MGRNVNLEGNLPTWPGQEPIDGNLNKSPHGNQERNLPGNLDGNLLRHLNRNLSALLLGHALALLFRDLNKAGKIFT